MRKNEQRHLIIQAAVVMLVLSALLVWFVRAETKPLGNSDLKIAVANSRSYASVANLLTDLTLNGKTTRPFFEAQTILLRDRVDQVVKTLDSAKVENGLEIKLWQARLLVRSLKLYLDSLHSAFSQAAQLNELKTKLGELVPRLRELEGTLD